VQSTRSGAAAGRSARMSIRSGLALATSGHAALGVASGTPRSPRWCR
jgi:hypothetical protein